MKITKKDIKGILKVLLMIILIAAAIGGTCYFFFKQFNKTTNSYDTVSNYVYSVDREEFASELNTINSAENSNGKLSFAIATLNQLSVSAKTLTPYLNGLDVDHKVINRSFREVNYNELLCRDSINEYLDRISDTTFDKNSVNKLQKNLASYLTSYSNLLNNINSQIEGNLKYKSVDLKFSVIDCFTRVVSNDYTNVSADIVVKHGTDNLKRFTNVIRFTGTNLNLTINNNTNNLNFINFYNNSDKNEFAKNLSDNVKKYTEFDVNYNSLQKASYYFGVIFKGAE